MKCSRDEIAACDSPFSKRAGVLKYVDELLEPGRYQNTREI